jgi:hypothetical protein
MTNAAQNEPTAHDWANAQTLVCKVDYPEGTLFEFTKKCTKNGQEHERKFVMSHRELAWHASKFCEPPRSVTRTHG